MSEQHFDGLLTDDERSPGGFERVDGATAVLLNRNTGRLVLMGQPSEVHNCDVRGCGSLEHKIAEFEVDKDVLEPHVETQWEGKDA